MQIMFTLVSFFSGVLAASFFCAEGFLPLVFPLIFSPCFFLV